MQSEKMFALCLPHGPQYGGVGRSTAPFSDRLEASDPIWASLNVPKATRALIFKGNPELLHREEIEALNDLLTVKLQESLGERLRSPNLKGAKPHTKDAAAVERHLDRLFAEMAGIIRTSYAEYTSHRGCSHCKGGGVVKAYYEEQGVVEEACQKCNGMGWRAWSSSKRAEGIGCDRESKRFLTILQPAYCDLLQFMTDEYIKAEALVMQALFAKDRT